MADRDASDGPSRASRWLEAYGKNTGNQDSSSNQEIKQSMGDGSTGSRNVICPCKGDMQPSGMRSFRGFYQWKCKVCGFEIWRHYKDPLPVVEWTEEGREAWKKYVNTEGMIDRLPTWNKYVRDYQEIHGLKEKENESS